MEQLVAATLLEEGEVLRRQGGFLQAKHLLGRFRLRLSFRKGIQQMLEILPRKTPVEKLREVAQVWRREELVSATRYQVFRLAYSLIQQERWAQICAVVLYDLNTWLLKQLPLET